MRVIFYTFISILGISLSVIILMPSFFDINNYKGKLESLVLSKTGNTLKINGNMGISFLTGLKLSVKDITYKSNDGKNLLKSKELLISPKLLSLLKGELFFNSIKIVKPTIYVVKKNNNKSNWEFAFYREKKKNIKKDINEVSENNNKKNKRKLNPLNIKSLNILDAIILTNIENKKKRFDNLNVKLDYKSENNYIIEGNTFYEKEKINFSYNLNYSEKNINLIGNIKGKGLEINNNTNFNTDTLNGKSTVNVYINKFGNFIENNFLRDQSLSLDANLSFSNKSIKFEDAKIKNKKNLINFKGEFTKQEKTNIVRADLTTDILDMNNIFFLNIKNKKLDEVNKEDTKNKNLNKNKQNNIVDKIFEKLNFYEVYTTFSAKEIIYKKHNVKNVNVKFSKKKNLNFTVSLNDKFIKKITLQSKINKEKISTFVVNANNLDIKKINDLMSYNKFTGLLNFSVEGKTYVKNKSSMLNQLNGQLVLHTKNMQIKDLNLKELKSSILAIKNIDNLIELNNKVFKGNTNIKDQEIFIEIKNGNLSLPKTDILLDENKIRATGFYEIAPKNLNVNLNYNDENNILLSLFNINFKGNIKNLNTSLDYDKEKTDQLIGDMVEKKMKKIIKEKLDNKFNDIIENLLD